MQSNLTYIPLIDEWIYDGKPYKGSELIKVLGIPSNTPCFYMTLEERPEAIDIALIW